MKKRLALAAAFAFSIIPFTSFADHLEPDESEIKKSGELVRTKLEDYDLFSNNFSDDILIALTVNGYPIEPGADLEGADLSGADLRELNLNGANLNGAIFDFDFVTVGKLPFSIDCPRKNQILRIKKNVESGNFVVRYPKGKKFYVGSKFDKALEEFEETYDNKCV